MTRRELMCRLASVRQDLREHGIRDAADYAEVLVAEALTGERLSGINKGCDVLTARYGRVEVKCRQLPPGDRLEERVEVGSSKADGFEFLAIVIFHTDFSVKAAVVAPYAEVWKLVETQTYNRISYSQASKLDGAVDITAVVRVAADR